MGGQGQGPLLRPLLSVVVAVMLALLWVEWCRCLVRCFGRVACNGSRVPRWAWPVPLEGAAIAQRRPRLGRLARRGGRGEEGSGARGAGRAP
eukprot:scaffold19583_cov28-Tisochrysis_lutea.AAC.1